MIEVKINSGDVTAGVTKDSELCVIPTPEPPFVRQRKKPFRQYLTADGTAGGSNDMGVDGSSTAVDFWVPADPTDDRYITRLDFIVAYDTSGQPNQWANGAALTNGSRLFYETQAGEVEIHDGIKSNQDFFRLRDDKTDTNWEVRHVNANNDFGYFVHFDLTSVMPPFGIKLDAGTTQKLVMRIRDNAGTDADTFDVIAMGFDRFK